MKSPLILMNQGLDSLLISSLFTLSSVNLPCHLKARSFACVARAHPHETYLHGSSLAVFQI